MKEGSFENRIAAFIEVVNRASPKDSSIGVPRTNEGDPLDLLAKAIENFLQRTKNNLCALNSVQESKSDLQSTDGKQRGGELAQVHTFLNALMKNVPDRIYFKDRQSRFIQLSLAHARLFSLKDPREATGKTDFDFFAKEHAQEAFQDEQRIIRTGEPIVNKEERETWPNRPDTWVMTTKTPLRDQQGTIIGIIGVSRDITEQKRIEEALRDSERQLKDIVDFLPDATLAIDRQGRVIIWNKAIERMTGISAVQMIGKGEHVYAIPFYGEAIEQLVDIALKGYEGIPERYSNVIREGDALSVEAFCNALYGNKGAWVFSKVSLLRDQSGNTIGAIESIRDINDQKLATEQLKESEEKFHLLFEQSADGNLILDNGYFVECNAAAFRTGGFTTKEQLIGLGPIDISPEYQPGGETSAAKAERMIALAYENGFHCFEWMHRRVDGSELALEVLLTAVPIKGRRLLHVTWRDISRRKNAENALRESEQRYRTLVENCNEGIFVAQDAMVKYANPAVLQLVGYSEQEISSIPFLEFIHPDDRALVGERHLRRLKGEKIESRYAFRLVCKNGDAKWIELSTVLIEFGGKPATLNIVTDITGRKLAEEEKAKLEEQLQQAQKIESVGRLAGGVAHDFNNMLGVIIGHTELAMEQVSPKQPLFADLKEIHKAAERSAALTRQLLAFARKQTVAPRVLDLNETIEGMLTMLERLIGEDVRLSWLPRANLWPVMMDPSQIDQLLTNLCVNARGAISDVGNVTIETRNCTVDKAYCADHAGFVVGEYVLLAVTDDGCGMDKATLSHLFEPFFTTKEMGKGTGLGLATIYGIVKQNNGFINVYSEPDHGTTFTIYLPRHTGKTEQARAEETEGPAARGRETILLVEDEPASLKLFKQMLEGQGYTVLEAGTPGEAIRLAREHGGEIHLLMTDLIMPEMNGHDLARNLTALFPRLKCLFASGYTADVIAHQGVLEKGMHFIQKPFSRKDLASKVREALESK